MKKSIFKKKELRRDLTKRELKKQGYKKKDLRKKSAEKIAVSAKKEASRKNESDKYTPEKNKAQKSVEKKVGSDRTHDIAAKRIGSGAAEKTAEREPRNADTGRPGRKRLQAGIRGRKDLEDSSEVEID